MPRDAALHELFSVFNFRVEIQVDGVSELVCKGGFAECDGLEMSVAPKTLREGGNNGQQIHLAAPVSYGQLTLKRGMTTDLDLWDWFEKVHSQGHRALRGDAEITVMAADGQTEQLRYQLSRCLPIKIKAPALNAKDGLIAVEEFQLAYEMLSIKRGGNN